MLYRITVKLPKNANGVRIEKGMFVDVVSNSLSNPVQVNGGGPVVDAFMNKYGVDLKKIGTVNTLYLETKRLQ